MMGEYDDELVFGLHKGSAIDSVIVNPKLSHLRFDYFAATSFPVR